LKEWELQLKQINSTFKELEKKKNFFRNRIHLIKYGMLYTPKIAALYKGYWAKKIIIK